ncbi:MAG: O-antigen ligase family protein [Acidobacteriota bacterium]
MLLKMTTLGWLAGLGLVLALFFPIWWLVLYDLCTAFVFGGWSISFLRLGPDDVKVAMIALALVLRARLRRDGQKLPLFWPWALLTLLFCLSYLNAPINQRNLTDPIRITYQLGRYCIRPLIYLPLIMLLIRSAHRTYAVMNAVIVAGIVCSLPAIAQGYSGISSTAGPFRTGNQLGGVLVMPMLIAMSGVVLPRSRGHWILSFVGFGLMTRAMLFSASRGAMVAAVGGALVYGAILLLRPLGRRRLRYLAPLGGLALLAALPFLPMVLAKPTIAHAMSAADGSKASTMQWRMQERWPHFWGIALDNPLVGIGTSVDLSLGDKANTPHNGFLSLLVEYGFPAFFLILFFAGRVIWNGLLLYRRAPDPDHRIFGVTCAAAVAGILTHQLVEVTMTAPFTFKLFWILVGTSELAKRWPNESPRLEIGQSSAESPSAIGGRGDAVLRPAA